MFRHGIVKDGKYIEIKFKLIPMKTGAELIAEERARQIEQEGHSIVNDLENYIDGELILASKSYAEYAKQTLEFKRKNIGEPTRALFIKEWPFGIQFWKPDDENPIKDLVKAGALIAAEIDRAMAEFPDLKDK